MANAAIAFLLLFCVTPLPQQNPAPEKQQSEEGPTSEKAQKTYKQGLDYAHQGNLFSALGSFKKADKQDGGRCFPCKLKVINCAIEIRDWKEAETATQEIVAQAQSDKDRALAHFDFAWVLMQEGLARHKDEAFARAHSELTCALAADPTFAEAAFSDGRTLALLKQDDAAKAEFRNFLKLAPADDPKRQRALRYLGEPELARARMVPAFTLTTLDGRHFSLDDLQGKVVLLDFWATWCEPCRAALPHMREIAKKFEGEPLVILSVSLDGDEAKWKDFVAKNGMTWLNYRDGGFTGPICRLFGVNAIPHTFTIDADGVLQDEHIGDASLEGKLKKLLAKARASQPAPQPSAP